MVTTPKSTQEARNVSTVIIASAHPLPEQQGTTISRKSLPRVPSDTLTQSSTMPPPIRPLEPLPSSMANLSWHHTPGDIRLPIPSFNGQHLGQPPGPPELLHKDNHINGCSNQRLLRIHRNFHHQLLQPLQHAKCRLRMHRAQPRCASLERFEHIERGPIADFPHNEPIRVHAEYIFHQIAHRHQRLLRL